VISIHLGWGGQLPSGIVVLLDDIIVRLSNVLTNRTVLIYLFFFLVVEVDIRAYCDQHILLRMRNSVY
jgi:hypothetical protein